MSRQTLWINVYRAGHFHRQGKPNASNLHGADLYPTFEAARTAAEEDKGYIATVPVDVPVPIGMRVVVNGPDSIAVRGDFQRLPWYEVEPPPAMAAWPYPQDATSLEVGDDVLGVSYAEWAANRTKSGFQPAPEAHKPVAALLRRPAHKGFSSYDPYLQTR